jgi:non-specific serine/threonine protein kinase
MLEVRLTPGGRLALDRPADEQPPKTLSAVQAAFEADWRGGLFALAARKAAVDGSLTLGYWQAFAQRYLTSVCHLPESTESLTIEPPASTELDQLVQTAPPMVGGEYLSPEVLSAIWGELHDWVVAAIEATGGLRSFLAAHAPQWHQVGRVCLHLAENKQDHDHPFAFLATYATGFGAGGQLKHLPLRRALEQYAGTANKPALIKLLTPVDQAARACEWVKQLVDSGQIYQPLAWSPQQAYTFLKSVPALEEAGLAVRVPDWWKKRPRPQVAVTIGEKKPSKFGTDALLDFDAHVALGADRLSEAELNALLSEVDDAGLVFVRGQWVEVDRDKLEQALDHWRDVERQAKDGQVTFVEGMRMLAGASADLREDADAQTDRTWVHVEAGEALREILSRLRQPDKTAEHDVIDKGAGVRATLRPYQRDGVQWMYMLGELGLGACLADDMGLGKTLQVLALEGLDRRADRSKHRRPSLLVVPASLLGNWQQEARRAIAGDRGKSGGSPFAL